MTIPDSPAPGTARGVAAIPSIAVVDDEAATREMVGDYLKLHGFAVVLCDGGRALREHLAHHSPDLIVLDLNMPEEDGLSIVRDIMRAHAGGIEITENPSGGAVFIVSFRAPTENNDYGQDK